MSCLGVKQLILWLWFGQDPSWTEFLGWLVGQFHKVKNKQKSFPMHVRLNKVSGLDIIYALWKEDNPKNEDYPKIKRIPKFKKTIKLLMTQRRTKTTPKTKMSLKSETTHKMEMILDWLLILNAGHRLP